VIRSIPPLKHCFSFHENQWYFPNVAFGFGVVIFFLLACRAFPVRNDEPVGNPKYDFTTTVVVQAKPVSTANEATTSVIPADATLTFSRNMEGFQFILVFGDYNPNSSLLALQNIRQLPFANQIKVFHTGFGM
jgi:hypothetical protein